MDNIEKVERYQLEYDLFECGFVGDFELVMAEVCLSLEEIDVARSVVAFYKNKNKRKRMLSKVLGKYAVNFGYYEPMYYDFDDCCLDRKNEMLDVYYNQLNSIRLILSEDNLNDAFKLMEYVKRKNRDFRLALEEERITLKKLTSGEDVDFPQASFEYKGFNDWVNGAVKEISYTEKVVKEKK